MRHRSSVWFTVGLMAASLGGCAGGNVGGDATFQDLTSGPTLGFTARGEVQDEGDPGTMTGSRVQVGAADVRVQSISAYVGPIAGAPDNVFSLAVYSDSNGSPSSLIATSIQGTLKANSWNKLPIAATLKANTGYWLVYNARGPGNSNNLFYARVSSNEGVYAPQPFGTWPAQYKGAILGGWKYSIFANVSAAPPPRTDGGAAPDAGGGGTGGHGGGIPDGGTQDGGTHTIGACSSLGPPGTWTDITPPQLNSSNWCSPQWNSVCPAPGETSASGQLATYGSNAFVIDPSNSATLYLGTSSLGIWKTTDCGATWVHINTGTNGAALDQGRNWTMVVDPTDSRVLYTCAGYGVSGVFKSVNGGVDWQQVLTSDVAAAAPYGGFVEKITLDPTNHRHLLVSFHGSCTTAGGGTWGCLAESTDAGQTWKLTNSAEEWTEGDGQTMVDSTTWFFGSSFGGIWRTTNAGNSWTQVYTGDASGAVYTAADGTFYVAGGTGVLHSSDGVNWATLADSPSGMSLNGSTAIVGNGTTLFTSDGRGGTEPAGGFYWSAPLSNTSSWTSMNGPAMRQGGIYLDYDPDHHVLYSSNSLGGFWRVVTP